MPSGPATLLKASTGIDSSAIVGTARPANLRRNLDAVGRGPLSAAIARTLRGAFVRQGNSWQGLI